MNAWSPVGGAVRVALGGVALLKEILTFGVGIEVLRPGAIIDELSLSLSFLLAAQDESLASVPATMSATFTVMDFLSLWNHKLNPSFCKLCRSWCLIPATKKLLIHLPSPN